MKSEEQKRVAACGLKAVDIGIVVKRADGRIDDYGIVSQWHKNPFMRLAREIGVRWRQAVRSRKERNRI